MDTERWRQIEGLFNEVVDLSEEKRRAVLEARAIDDPALVSEVVDLLANDSTTDGLMDSDLIGGIAEKLAPAPALVAGERLGPWEIVEQIGRGGMGEVFSAVRADGAYEQRVAVKVIRGVLNEAAMERLRIERQLLARLEHPNIARLQDGGTTESGAPYLVMEFVDGDPIDRYCDALQLGLDDRLRLFLEVCEAVAHAHLHLVVHRDLKPGNVLVSKEGHLKLLDFGISKALSADTDLSVTAPDSRPMTPRYAAPEQILGNAITTATDVYSLGVMLYELLTGLRPHEHLAHDLHLHERAVCDDLPATPSTAVLKDASDGNDIGTSVARSRLRAAKPLELRRRLSGDLDVVVMYALRKDPERRYPNAAALREDLLRVLDRRPVSARRDTVAYRTARFVTRHRAAAVLLSLLVIALVVGTVTATRFAMLAKEEAVRADQKAAQALKDAKRYEGVSRFLTSLLSAPGADIGAEAPMSAYLEFAERRLSSPEHVPDRVTRGSIHAALGLAWQSLSHFEDAKRQLLAAVECYEGDGSRSARADVLGMLGSVYSDLGKYDDAEAVYRRAIRDLEEEDIHHPARVDQLGNLAGLLIHRGNLPEAERELSAAIELSTRLRSESSLAHATLLAQHADLLLILGRELDQAEAEVRRALQVARRARGEDDATVRSYEVVLARILLQRGHPEEARQLATTALDRLTQVVGEDSPTICPYLDLIAKTFMDAEPPDTERAEQLLRRALAIHEKTFGPDHPGIANRLSGLAELLCRTGQLLPALACYERVIAVLQSTFGEEDHTSVFTARLNAGLVLTELDRFAETREQLSVAYAAAERMLGQGDERTVEIAYRAGLAEELDAASIGDPDAAARGRAAAVVWYERGYQPALAGEAPMNDHAITAVLLHVGIAVRAGEADVAEVLIDRAVARVDAAVDPAGAERLREAKQTLADSR